MVTHREIIEDIQKNTFGIGLVTDPQSQKVIENLKGSLNRTLEQLSEDLYSKESHFVLELIQNADDNDYDKGTIPFLKFIVDSSKLHIQNNEMGFTEDNVRALSDVGKTTKNRVMGYIGEKGIGFKSVFRISNEPIIFSNGFRFHFKHKDQDDILGFVIPYWVKEIPNYVDEELTNIVLPLREDVKDELSKLNEIEPTLLLLFLHKLKIIEIHNKIENTVNKVIRHDRNGIVEIEHSKGKEYWKLIPKLLKPQNIHEEKRVNVKETEMILGFPLRHDGTSDATNEQKVFAYLPTRAYGFKFIIHADFLLPASREDIHKDKPWNKWLRDNVVSVFLRAIEEFIKDEKLGTTYYNYIPLESEVTDDFFHPVVGQIFAALKETECILAESKRWLKPKDVFHADEEIRELVSNQDLVSIFGKEFVSSEIKPKLKREVLKGLGITTFEISHLLHCLTNIEWLKEKTDEWFGKLYSYINRQTLEEKQVKELRDLKIIRLENGQLTSISEGTIFLQLDRKASYGFEKEMRVMKRTLIEIQEKEIKDDLLEFLKTMGVRNPSPYEIIENHILPIYESDDKFVNMQSKDPKILLGYLRYIKDNVKNYEEESDRRINSNKQDWQVKEDPLKRLKSSLLIRINKNGESINSYDRSANIYLPRAYGNENELERLFEGINEVAFLFLHREYIDDIIERYRKVKRKSKKGKAIVRRKRDAEIKDWKDFFIRLGVSDGLLVKSTGGSYLTWEDRLKLRGFSSGRIWEEITDYLLEPLKQILNQINEGDQYRYKANLLIALLEKKWKDLSKYGQLSYEWGYRTRRRRWKNSADAAWVNLLKTSKWVPTTKGVPAKPSEVFISRPEIKEVLGDSVPYLSVDIKSEDLVKTLGFKTHANTQQLLNYLEELVEDDCRDKETFAKLYDFLNKHYEGNGELIASAFSEKPLIFLPATSQHYYRIREVLWKDAREVFGERRGCLERPYPKLRTFFVAQLGVTEKPEPKEYANVLIDLSKESNIGIEEEKIIFRIYGELNSFIKYESGAYPISGEDWWKVFIKERIYWTDKGEFWCNEGDVFINDNQELYELFKGNPNNSFLKIPDNNYIKYKALIDTTGISYLSKAVEVKLIAAEDARFIILPRNWTGV